jgi:hypothetical protein
MLGFKQMRCSGKKNTASWSAMANKRLYSAVPVPAMAFRTTFTNIYEEFEAKMSLRQ